MAQFRALKTRLRTALSGEDWHNAAAPILAEYGRQNVGPLFSFLLLGGEMTGRAALCLGDVVATMADARMEDGRVILRRLMWHMNEESGNIGWGIPEAMAACLVAHEGLAKEFHRILLSYIRDREGDSNFCDYAPLRRHCFWAVGSFVRHRPELVVQSGLVPALFEALVAGLGDDVVGDAVGQASGKDDAPCRAYAAWALGECLEALGEHVAALGEHEETLGQEREDHPIYKDTDGGMYKTMHSRLTALLESQDSIELFENGLMREHRVAAIARGALEVLASLRS